MPTYDYECRSCSHRFEAFQSIRDDALTTCPECGKEELRRLIGGGTGIIFKGSGFYVNDSRRGASSGAAQESSAGASAATSKKGGESSSKKEAS